MGGNGTQGRNLGGGKLPLACLVRGVDVLVEVRCDPPDL